MRVSKTVFPLIALWFSLSAKAQTVLHDDFSDGDLGKSPTWVGDLGHFVTTNGQLQLKTSGSGISYLSTQAVWADTASWSFYFALDFSPSTSNLIKVYLSYDRAQLNEPGNGLYLKVGRSGNDDNLELYRQKGSSLTKLGEGSLGSLGGTLNQAHVQVTRSRTGEVRVMADFSGNNKPILEFELTETEIRSGSYVGISCTYTSTRSDKFFFDDLRLAPLYLDTVAPKLTALSILTAKRLSLTFTEPLDSSSAANPANYAIGGNQASEAWWTQASPWLVELELAYPVVSGNSYTLGIHGIQDPAGNTASGILWPFTYYLPDWGHVLINEFMADPSPSNGLPDAEFVELYNHTNNNIDLQGWTLSDGSSTAGLPAYTLNPGSYLILCASSQASLFGPYGEVLGISLPALNNSGDKIILRSADNTLIDRIIYSMDWYANADKNDGGYSLERKSWDTACTGAHHWMASVHPLGGSPGAVNSVFTHLPDTTAPSLSGVIAMSGNELALYFSENIDSSTAMNGTYELPGYIGKIAVSHVQPRGNPSIRLVLSPGIDSNTWYDLKIDGVGDCKGNVLKKKYKQALMYLVPKLPKWHDLVITEIFADPEPSQGLPNAEFIEVYNRMTWPISLEGSMVTDGRDTARIDSLTLFPHQYVVLCATSGVADFTPYGSTKGLSKFPSLNNGGETLYLRGPNGRLIHQVDYRDTWYGSDTKKDGGYALEMLDTENPCGREENWKGALDGSYATPGRPNSQSQANRDVTPPQLIGAWAVDSTRIEIVWSETMYRGQLAALDGYSLNLGITVLSSNPLDSTWTRSLLALGNALQPGEAYTLTAKGLKDCVGNLMAEKSLELALPETPSARDLVINEVLFNPQTGGSDFVELYNISKKYINLRDVLIGGAESPGQPKDIWWAYGPGHLLAPGGYVALCADPSYIASQYETSGAILLEAQLPTLPDSEGDIGIYNKDTTLIDALHYLEDWHYPLLAINEGVSLERVDPAGPTQSPANWRSAASWIGGATPGYKNSQYRPELPPDEVVTLSSPSFSPDNDGYEDAVTVRIASTGQASVSIKVYALDGQLVRQLVPHDLLGSDSRYAWDGLDEMGQLQPVGIYLLYVEIVDLDSGKTQVVKKPVVRAAKL